MKVHVSEIVFHIPVTKKNRHKLISFYEEYFNFTYRKNSLYNKKIRLNFHECDEIINSYISNNANEENLPPLLTFVIDKNFASLCLKMKLDKVKFIWGIKYWTTAGVKILDPCGNVIFLNCIDDFDENGTTLEELEFLNNY